MFITVIAKFVSIIICILLILLLCIVFKFLLYVKHFGTMVKKKCYGN